MKKQEPVNCSDSELCTYLQELEAGYLPTFYSDTNQFAPSKSMSIASKSYQRGRKTVSFHGFQSLTMCKHSTEYHGAESLTLLQEDSRAKILARPGKAQALTASGLAYGGKWPESLVKYDHDSYSWKTHRCLWEEELPWSSVILPRWGMTLTGVVLQHPMLERPTKWTDSGLWPTPRVFMHKDSTVDRGKSNLGEVVGGPLNPNWIEWLMGWPIGWTDLQPLAMDKFQEWRQQHGGC